tara:strand:+ start:975 stop:1199 length:225 start_codon:yes stop_codon:yes gene_type:complete
MGYMELVSLAKYGGLLLIVSGVVFFIWRAAKNSSARRELERHAEAAKRIAEGRTDSASSVGDVIKRLRDSKRQL